MFVAQFIGSPKMNFFSADDITTHAAKMLINEADILGIRPEHMRFTDAKKALVMATPDLIENLGEVALVHCKTAHGKEFIAKTTDLSQFELGREIGLTADKTHLNFFNSQTEKRIG